MKKLNWLGVITGLTVISAAPFAVAQQSAAQALAECREITSSIARLECYDQLEAGNLQGRLNRSERANERTVIERGSSRQQERAAEGSEEDRFGDFGKPEQREDGERMPIVIASATKNRLDRWVIETESGQIWEQSEAETYSISVGEEYYIERGAFSNYFLGQGDSNRRIRVRRTD